MRLLWQFGHVGSFQCKRTSLFNADKRLIVYWRLTTIGIRPRSSIRFVADQPPSIARGSLSNVVVARTAKNLSAENKTDLAAALNPVSSVRRFCPRFVANEPLGRKGPRRGGRSPKRGPLIRCIVDGKEKGPLRVACTAAPTHDRVSSSAARNIRTPKPVELFCVVRHNPRQFGP